MSRKITYKDVDKFFEIRQDKEKLVKICVSLSVQQVAKYGLCNIYSNLWEKRVSFVNECWMYIGPKTEKKQMMDKLRSFYSINPRIVGNIRMGEIQKADYFSSKFLIFSSS